MKTLITKMMGIEHPIIQGGMVAGLISDIPTCKELIDNIMQEANDIITKPLSGMLEA